MEEMAVEEDKVNHLNKLKIKMEGTIDDLHSSLEKERKGKADVEKSKRKLEGDLKATQEVVDDLERRQSNLEENMRR